MCGELPKKALTMGRVYPPTKRWRELTAQEKGVRLDIASDLLPILQWNRGDPRLTHWEEGFLTGMVRVLQTYQGKAKVSPKQWDKIRLILDKVDQPAPTETEEVDDLAIDLIDRYAEDED